MSIAAVVQFYEEFSPESLVRFADVYRADAYFKDPFNEVSGVSAIQGLFAEMFDQVDAPKFIVTEAVGDDQVAVLVWTFQFTFKRWRQTETQTIRGVSHLKFDENGRIRFHRDYWDPIEELYVKLPVIGVLCRWLARWLGS